MSTQTLVHLSVLGEEAPAALVTNPDGIYVDGTFGRGGHSRRILSKLSKAGRLIAFDRDLQAIAAASAITDSRFSIIHEPFSKMKEELNARGIDQVNGIFLDIGVSSPQIDDANRGFSFRFDGPLDMRMDTSRGLTAAQWLMSVDEKVLARVIRDYGEEKMANAIARAIVARRQVAPIVRTQELAQLVAGVVPRNKKDVGQHPATRTFQAIRIEINQELEELSLALNAAGALLATDARLAVISFHSLEDRLVKRFFERAAHPERDIDPRLPLTVSELPRALFTDITRIKPGQDECDVNPRARSAVLRVGTRTSELWPEVGHA